MVMLRSVTGDRNAECTRAMWLLQVKLKVTIRLRSRRATAECRQHVVDEYESCLRRVKSANHDSFLISTCQSSVSNLSKMTDVIYFPD